MPADVPIDPSALVVRFRPISPPDVLRWAGKEHSLSGRFGLSVFADVKRGDETDDDLKRRLVNVAGMGGINLESNRKFYVCTAAAELLQRGFVFYKNEYEDEPQEHYSVDLGPGPTVEDVERFLESFPVTERTPK